MHQHRNIFTNKMTSAGTLNNGFQGGNQGGSNVTPLSPFEQFLFNLIQKSEPSNQPNNYNNAISVGMGIIKNS